MIVDLQLDDIRTGVDMNLYANTLRIVLIREVLGFYNVQHDVRA